MECFAWILCRILCRKSAVSKRSFTWPTPCRPPTADHRGSRAPHHHLGARLPGNFAFSHFLNIFALFLRRCQLPQNVLVSGGSEVVRERSGNSGSPVFSVLLRFHAKHANGKQNRQTRDLQNCYCGWTAWVTPGSSRGLFFQNSEIRKTHFSRKGPKTENTRHFPYTPVFWLQNELP